MQKIPERTRDKIIAALSNKESTKVIAEKFSVSKTTVCNIRANISAPQTKDGIIKKGTEYKIRVTSFISGSVKTKFVADVIKSDLTESKMAAHIFDVYYHLHEIIPNFDKIDKKKIKDYLKARIKL